MELKQKVLVVDDERCIRKFLRTLLEVDGFDVEAVSSGKEALTKISNGERPDFILLDILMPEMNGLDTLQELMRLDRSLNVIMQSCSNWHSTVAEAFRLGARDYLVHPFEKAELDEAMLGVKQRSRGQIPQGTVPWEWWKGQFRPSILAPRHPWHNSANMAQNKLTARVLALIYVSLCS
jgi:two-component system chemotaxis response regulator CheY